MTMSIIKKIINRIKKYRQICIKILMRINHYTFLETDYNPQLESHIRTNKKKSSKSIMISHIATYSKLNSGDTLLPVCVKDSIAKYIEPNIKWKSYQIGLPYTKRHINALNTSKGIIIGGGGLFLNRRNPKEKHPSDWHWNCSIELTEQIKTPIAFFAVGYNQFRNDGGLSNKFRKHINSLNKNIKFIGMRNNGSIDNIKNYLDNSLHEKVIFQPCPTTIISKLYPEIFEKNNYFENKIIGINCAFDRPERRYAENIEQICNDIALSLKYLSKNHSIRCYIHSPSDAQIIPFLKRYNIKHKIINLVNKSPHEIINSYLDIDLMMGMRGHSQMIPFGCRVPILSLISHNKMKYFLEDIDKNDWGIEIQSDNLKEQIIEKAESLLRAKKALVSDIEEIQKHFKSITQDNSNFILEKFLD